MQGESKALEGGAPCCPTSAGIVDPRWQLRRPQEGAAMLEVGDSKGGGVYVCGGQGQGETGMLCLAGWKASPLSGPSLSWGVGKEGPADNGGHCMASS